MAEEKFFFDSLQDSETIADFLQALTDGFAQGRISLSSNGDSIELCPSGMLGFNVKAKKKRGSSKVSIKISWKEPGREEPSDPSPLKVG